MKSTIFELCDAELVASNDENTKISINTRTTGNRLSIIFVLLFIQTLLQIVKQAILFIGCLFLDDCIEQQLQALAYLPVAQTQLFEVVAVDGEVADMQAKCLVTNLLCYLFQLVKLLQLFPAEIA